MAKCVLHPGRKSDITVFHKTYCKECKEGITNARANVDGHVVPKECFVWYKKASTWEQITGTGCAHWVAHQLGIHSDSQQEKCLDGYIYRVSTLVLRTSLLTFDAVKVNDVFVNLAQDHTGLVIKVVKGEKKEDTKITIRHDSSRQGKVAEDDFKTYFGGSGTFRRFSEIPK